MSTPILSRVPSRRHAVCGFAPHFFSGAAAVCFVWTAAAQPATAQTLTYRLPAKSRYSLRQDEGFKLRTNPDGTTTARVLVTFRFLAPPPLSCRSRATVPQILPTPIGVLGEKLGQISLNDQLKDKSTTAGQLDPQTGQIAVDAATLQKQGFEQPLEILQTKIALYNTLRDLAPRDEQDRLRLTAVGAANEAAEKTVQTVVNPDAAFAYGDWLTNAREARALAWFGTSKLSLKNQRDSLDALNGSKSLRMLSDPAKIASADAGFAPDLSDTSFQKYGRWFFEVYKDTETTNPRITNLFGVRVEWAMEVTFDPKNPPKASLFAGVTSAPSKKPEANSASSQPADTPAAEAAPAGETGTTLLALAAGSPFAGLGQPGVDLVAGPTILNNGTPFFAGLNLHSSQDVKGRFNDWTRIGGLVGQTLGSGKKSIILAPSLAINNNAIVFAGASLFGGAYSDSNHTTRQSLAFGVAIRLSISGVTKDEKDKKTDENKMGATVLAFDGPTPPYEGDCAASDYTVLLFTSALTRNFTYDFVEAESQQTQSGTIALNDLSENDRNYWLTFVRPGRFVSQPPSGFHFEISEITKAAPLGEPQRVVSFEKGRLYKVNVVANVIAPPSPATSTDQKKGK